MSQHSIVRKSPAAKEPVRKATAPDQAPIRKAATEPAVGGPLAAAGPAVPLQKSVPVGAPNDPTEQQAEHVADKVAAGEKAPAVAAAPASDVVKKSAASGQGAQEETLAAKAIDEKGPGRPLPQETRSSLETSMGRDLGDVRVHDDPAARQSAAGLGARAFTHGNDVFLGPGESARDTHLMAHEATHVLQQSDTVRKTNGHTTPTPATGGTGGTPAAPASSDPVAALTPQQRQTLQTLPQDKGRLVGTDTILFDRIEIPPFKMDDHRGVIYNGHLPLKRKKRFVRGNTDQRNVWKTYMSAHTTGSETKLKEKHRARTGADPAAGELVAFAGKNKHGGISYFFGDLRTAATELALPEWDHSFANHSFDVDHILELQLGDWNTNPWPNTAANMELLDSSTNQSSGSTLEHRIEAKAGEFIQASGNVLHMDERQILDNFHLHFAEPSQASTPLNQNLYWKREQIEAGDHLTHVTSVDPAVMSGGAAHVRIFGGNRGQGKLFTRGTAPVDEEPNWLKPFKITQKHFNPPATTGDIGTLTVEVQRNDPHFQTVTDTVTVERIGNIEAAGRIDKAQVMNRLRYLRVKKMSPVRIDNVDLDNDGIMATGAVLPELPFLRNSPLTLALDHGDVEIFKRFELGGFTVPRPFRVTNTNLDLGWGTRQRFFVRGQVDFGVERLGQGFLRAMASQAEDFELEGRFNFDSRMFDQAEVGMWYRRHAFGGSGDLRIGPGKVRGIRSGSLHVEFGEGQPFRLNGSVQPNIPGVQEGTIQAEYSEANGLMITGTLQLSDRIPGLRSGRVEVQLHRSPEGEYELAARGTAQPRIPGVNATINVAYANGIFTAEGNAAYQRGPMSGQVQIGVTNGPVEGPLEGARPARGAARGGTAATGPLRAYGGGQLSLRLTPWLQGTIGVRLLPNGEMEVSGRVGLPDVLNIFEQRRYSRTLFQSPSLDIPIIGVAAAGQRIGIFFTLSGGLDASASIGPGQLRELGLSVTYNPDHPEQARVQGRASLHIPADAGLRLWIRGGLGAGIPIVSASANLEIGGRLGLEGALNAGVQVDWSPARGLVIDAMGEIMVQPAFTFDISALLLVEADIGITSFELYSRRWNLASFRYGSNLQFGLRFPVHYEEGRPFNISLNDIQFIRPEIDPLSTARGIMRRLTGSAATE